MKEKSRPLRFREILWSQGGRERGNEEGREGMRNSNLNSDFTFLEKSFCL